MFVRASLGWAALVLFFAVGCNPPPEPDTTPPEVLATEPADGQRGVLKNVEIVIRFSEPMDPVCTEAAYDAYAPGLRPGEVTFAWDDAATLRIRPNDPLAYSDDENDKVYTFIVHKTACDRAGNPMIAQYVARFYVLRKLTGTLYSEAALDGHVASDGQVYDSWPQLGTGDGSNDVYAQAFLSFDLSQLNPDPVEVLQAQLVLRKEQVTGSPTLDLGQLIVEHVYFGPSLQRLGVRALQLEPLEPDEPCSFDDLSGTWFTCWKSGAVQDDVDHWAARSGRSQFRLRFLRNTDGDRAEDSIQFDSGDATHDQPQLVLRYYAP
ncbi:Ig-like domain-containing protein [Oceanithermus sp.]